MTESARIPTLSTLESLSYGVTQVLPNYLSGLFSPNPFWFGAVSRIHPDPAGVKLIGRWREKYQSGYFYLRLPGKKSLLVLEEDGIRQVLDHSPETYAEPALKRKGMSYFQPEALTISRGEDWQERRRFNEAVLASDQQVHPFAKRFLHQINRSVDRLQKQPGKALVWEDFSQLFQRLTLQIIFGKEDEDAQLTGQLKELMQTANRGILLRNNGRSKSFYQQLREQLHQARPATLAELCTQVPSTDNTRVENQLPHWMFAMGDTLAINSVRALALIASHTNAEEALRQEFAQGDLTTPEGINELAYLEGCLQEAMRLWPTTPMLVRETVAQTRLKGEPVPIGTQVIINNSFNHRDRQRHSFADRFAPEIWQDHKTEYLFNHLSNGRQVCAGKNLAIWIGKAVLARLLTGQRYQLVRPNLDPRAPLPYRYNHFQVEFMRQFL